MSFCCIPVQSQGLRAQTISAYLSAILLQVSAGTWMLPPGMRMASPPVRAEGYQRTKTPCGRILLH